MKLEKYVDKDKKRRKVILISISVIVLISVSLLLYKTFASFREEVEFPIMNGKVDYFGNSDVYFAFYKGNEQLEEMPSKDNNEGLVFIDGECDNGASIEWNKEEWSPLIKNLTKSKTKCTLYFNDKYIDRELNGTDPVLNSKLIPITINEENGHVTRADEKEKWYDYENQRWANAVILRDGKTDPGAGVEIAENDIESYFVWIPRYRYQIFDEGNYNGLTTKTNKAKIINIEFESKDKPVQNGTSVGQWLTHPAFTSFNTNGIWVGKFETGYDGAESTGAAQVNPVDEASAIEAVNKVIIKPNVYSWRGIQIAKAYTIGIHYEKNLNSHMMKNTEWGAVAYLSQSKYGIGKEFRLNNNLSYLTGYAARHEPTIGYTGTDISCTESPGACNERGVSKKGQDSDYNTNYFNNDSVIASTTGNYSGIYDMSGGAWEYVMAVIDDGNGNIASGRNNLYNSGFNGTLTCPTCDVESGNDSNITKITNGIEPPSDSRYFDIYNYDANFKSYYRGILGDATKEMGPFSEATYIDKSRAINSWYNDEAWFINNNSPWVERGGCTNNGIGSGILTFDCGNGASVYYVSYRLALAF